MIDPKKIRTFRAFRNRNYRLFFCGQSISQIGTWMQRTGVSWVVYTLTHSTFMLGLSVFASQFPSFLLSLFGGIVSDRYHRYKVLIITQTASMIQAVILAALVLAKNYTVWEILGLSVVLGVINAFDVPARQPLVHDLVSDKSELPNALALNSSMVNVARLTGPALAGFVLEKFGAGFCFLVNALSFMAVIVSLLLLKLPPYAGPVIKKKVITELTEGYFYIKRTPLIRLILIMLSIVCLLVMPYDTLLPVFAKVVFKGNALTFGIIYSFIGMGAICGTFFLASLKPGTNLTSVLFVNTVILAIGLISFSRIHYLPIAMLFAVLIGFGAMSQGTISITVIQVNSAAAMRGRVISYLAMAMFGMLPLGSLLIGIVSQQISAPNAMLCQGFLALTIVAVFSNFMRKDKVSKGNLTQFNQPEELMAENI